MMGFVGFLVLALSGALSSMASLGVYGNLRDKGWGTWKASATTGAVGGAVAGLLFWAGSSYAERVVDALRLPSSDMAGLAGSLFSSDWSGVVIQSAPRAMAGIVAQKLSGLTMEQVNGLNVNLGGYAVDPRTLQLLG